MKKEQYAYEKRLNFIPQDSLWKHNFEEEPYASELKALVAKMYEETAKFEPKFDTGIQKKSFIFQGKSLTFYKISPNGRSEELLPAIVYYHGGGFNCPISQMILNNSCFYANRLNCHVFVLEYDLAPLVASDLILEECYGFYSYLLEHGEEQKIHMPALGMGDRLNTLTVYGDSAGGALAAGMVMLARDRGKALPGKLMLVYPVGDWDTDEEKYPSMGLSMAEWNKQANGHMWNMLFSKGKGTLGKYMAPLQNTDFGNMPDSYIEVCEFDSLRDQGRALHEALVRAGNASELCEIKGAYHGYDGNIENEFVRMNLERRGEVMKKWLEFFR